MKSFFENCLLIAGMCFVFWVMVTAGVGVKLSWYDEEIISFKIGGLSDLTKQEYTLMSIYNASETEYEILLDSSLLIGGTDASDYVMFVYPQYNTPAMGGVMHWDSNGHPYYITSHEKFIHLILKDRITETPKTIKKYFEGTASESSNNYSVITSLRSTKWDANIAL